MSKQIRFLLLLLLIVVNSLVAKESDDEKLIRQSVIGYNHGVMKAAKTGNPDTLRYLCERDQYLKATIWIKSWHDATVYMDAKLDTIDFKKIEQTEKSATVETEEKWFFKYLYMKDHTEVYPEREINYKLRYHLVNSERRWKIKDIEVLDEQHTVDDPQILIRPNEKKAKN